MRHHRILFWLCALSAALVAKFCTAADATWDEYKVIMWIGDTAWKHPEKFPLLLQRFRELGINAGMVYGDADPKPWVEAKFPYYYENIVNRGLCLKWNSNVRDWDKFVTQWAKSGRPKSAFIRDYCLDDPVWLASAKNQMSAAVRRNMSHHPLLYDIRDELSTTISANPFDYDFNPITLKKFRAWLQTQYKDLTALNAQWETKFNSWDEVMPFSTDEIKNRMASGDALPRGNPDWQALANLKPPWETTGPSGTQAPRHFAPNVVTRWNLSPWCDFRTYMDISLASALDEIRQAAHEVDPRALVGIEGTQMPHAFGGYNLWRLSQVLDWVEPYDIGNARPIFGSFMPGKPMFTTVGESDTNRARRRLWHLLLEGDKGCILWWSEDWFDWNSPDLTPTAKARAISPVLKELTGPLARLFMRSQREYDPIAIHYSQPSVQVDWLIESCEDGSTWPRRFSSYEADHSHMARDRNACLQTVRDAGYSPRFVSTAQIERGAGLTGCRVLLMPGSLALSDKEAAQIRAFTGIVASDVPVGVFDEHGKLRQTNPLPRVAPFARATESVIREVTVVTPQAHTAVYRYRLGNARLLAFERNVPYHMSEELKQKGGNEALEKPIDLEAKLHMPAHVYDLRAGKYLGKTDRLRFALDPWQPSLFAMLPEKVPAEGIVAALLESAP